MDTFLAKVQALLKPEHQRILYTTTGATAFLALLAYSRHCYVEWHALGEGGVPHDLRGWLINVVAHVVARRDHRGVPAPYEKRRNDPKATRSSSGTEIVLSSREEERYGPWSRVSFFSEGFSLPAYGAARPAVPTTVLPQRQTTRTAGAAAVARQNAYLRALAAANPALLAVRPSALESPKFEALWLVPGTADPASVRWFPPQARGEVAHVHPEGSTHVCLSLADAAEVVRRGWGERHKMSGISGVLPWGYVLLYAPREEGGDGEADWNVWKELVVAGARVWARSAGFEGEIVVPE